MAGIRRALVTGASSGIGDAFARALAARGCDLVLVARRGDRLEKLAADLGPQGVMAEVLPADLAEADGQEAVARRLRDAEAPVDLLVNNAGLGLTGAFAGNDPAAIDRVVAVNMTAVVRLTHAALPGMIARRRGGVINVGSVAGLLPGAPNFATYAASKAFVRTFTEGVAAETRRTGVRVTCVLPGYVRTEMTTDLQERGMPGPAWVSRERVVAEALRALAAGRPMVVPGAQYKTVDGLLRLLPRTLVRAGVTRATT